jgi:hypothetical protein
MPGSPRQEADAIAAELPAAAIASLESDVKLSSIAELEPNSTPVEQSNKGHTTIEQVTTNTSQEDPLGFAQHKRANIKTKELKSEYPSSKRPRKLKKYYSKQNALIDAFLGSGDEERLAALDIEENGKKIKIAVYGSFLINLGLFVIQLYAAISTGSLSLFATATDAFVSVIPRRCGRVWADLW